ncbi:MAG: hypothetical protein HRU49_01835 [Winogradskyella sp.]|uniref:PsbP-related protein n=1 Tax=Winogradskyella sp. TaxID=1883156 RepID=UPI0025EFEE1F|nr:PsbP-related protein [Winogradskyella sp.]NRB82509.1 hypothetical protein [Winogradskyella sp.]
MKISLLSLIFTVLTTAIFAQDGWKTYQKDNYSINYPSNWEYSDQKPEPTIAFIFMSPEASQTKDSFRERVNLTIENLVHEDLTLEAYTEKVLKQVKQVPNAKMASALPVTIGDIEATNIIWSAELGGGMNLKFNQLFTVKDRVAYVLTFASTTTEYERYEKDAIMILNSFKFTK